MILPEAGSLEKEHTRRPRLEISSPKKGEAARVAPVIWAAYREMRVAAEAGVVGSLAGLPDEEAVVTAHDAAQSFGIDGTPRFGKTAAEIESAIRNQKQRRSQMLVAWLNNGSPKVVGFGMLNNRGGERTFDHFSVSDLGRRYSAGIHMVAKAVEFHEGNPFTAQVIQSDQDALRQHRGLGFEDTDATAIHTVADVEVPVVVMRHPGA